MYGASVRVCNRQISLLLAVTVMVVLSSAALASAVSAGVVLRTPDGLLEGVALAGGSQHAFRGIPFAKVGVLLNCRLPHGDNGMVVGISRCCSCCGCCFSPFWSFCVVLWACEWEFDLIERTPECESCITC